MKTLKKVLAVVLALAMVLGMTITASAAFAGETIKYKEAVDVMNGLGIIVGDANGKFNPTNGLTRAEACKLIAYMMGYGDIQATSSFTDCKGHWADAFIAYCQAEGIVDGVGGGKFNPEGKLTGYAWAKMCLAALGYRADLEKLTGDKWAVNTAKLVKDVKLAKGIKKFAAADEISREEAAQVAFNTLKSKQVSYTTSVNSNGVTTWYLETTLGKTLAADNFSKLKQVVGTGADGQPNHTWYYKGTKIGTYSDAETAVATYTGVFGTTTDMTNKVTADVASYEFPTLGTVVYTNGNSASAATKTVSDVVGYIENGYNVSLFANEDKKIDRITIYYDYLGKVVSKSTTSKSVLVELNGVKKTVPAPKSTDSADTKAFYEAVYALNAGTYFTYNFDDSKTPDEYYFLGECTKVSAVKCTYKDVNTYGTEDSIYTLGDAKYQINKTNSVSLTVGTKYDLVLTTKGYIANATVVEATNGYVVSAGTDGAYGAQKYYATVLWTNGTEEDIQITKDAYTSIVTTGGDDIAPKLFVAFTAGTKGYTVASVGNQTPTFDAQKITASQTDALASGYILKAESNVYIYNSTTEEYDAYTAATMPTVYLTKDGAVAHTGTDGYIDCLVINDSYAVENVYSNIFVTSAAKDTKVVDNTTFYEYDVLADGYKTTVWATNANYNTSKVLGESGDFTALVDEHMYAVKATDAEGNITVVTEITGDTKVDANDAIDGAMTLNKAGVKRFVENTSSTAFTILLNKYDLTLNSSKDTATTFDYKLTGVVTGAFTCYDKDGNVLDITTPPKSVLGKTIYVVYNATSQVEWIVVK